MVRDAAKGALLEQKWGVATYRTLDALLAHAHPLFVVVSVSKPAAPSVLHELADRGVPVLTETPPAPDVNGLHDLYRRTLNGARIQVAEQYAFQPVHAARLSVAHSGKLGRVSQAQVSVTQDYHGMSLIRTLLGLQFENAVITARRFVSPIVAGPSRQGPPQTENILAATQTIAYLDFGDKLGVYDYTSDQHRSWIRSPRVLVRGDRGEINNTRIKYLQDFSTPITLDLLRQDAGEEGNLEGYYHTGILAGDEWVYRNPFIPARLNDDELAVATCLANMTDYVQGGPSFYSLAEAAQDHYLGLMVAEAVASGESISTTSQPWGTQAIT
jgi:predicted dehydrogenase